MRSRGFLAALSLLALCLLGAERSGSARNAILFIGDGMGIAMVTAARIHGHGPAGRLAMELPHAALVRTFSLDRLVTDSGAAATALLSGERVASGVIGMSPATQRACSAPERPDGSSNPMHPCAPSAQPIPSLADLAAQAGMSVGVVTTTRITHATPAALYAHVDERDREAEIAAQLVARNDLAFVAGGGRRFFLPGSWRRVFGRAGARTDGRDLLQELREQGVSVAESGEALRQAVETGESRIVALLAEDHLPFELERRAKADKTGLPSLAELTELAVRHLARSGQGYFLLVEGGRMDHAQHQNRALLALIDTLALDEAVASARRLTDEKDTLIVVTSDHGQPLVIAGYALVDDPVLGLARGVGIERRDEDGDGKPDYLRADDGGAMTTLLFANGPGQRGRASREDPAARGEQLFDPAYRQYAGVPLRGSTHEGSDVMASAVGPGAEHIRGFLDNIEIFRVIRAALGL